MSQQRHPAAAARRAEESPSHAHIVHTHCTNPDCRFHVFQVLGPGAAPSHACCPQCRAPLRRRSGWESTACMEHGAPCSLGG